MVGFTADELWRFRTAMDATGDAIFLVNRATMRFVEVNATATRMLGYSRQELLTMGPEQVAMVSFEQLERVYDALIDGRTTGELSETPFRRKDGSDFWVEANRQAQRSGPDWVMVEVMRDITERMEAQARVHRLAHYDALTCLPNRSLFHETLKATLDRASKGGWLVAVLCIGLDHFKSANETLGRTGADALLALFGTRLAQCVRVQDIAGRLGGDEFAVMLVMRDEKQALATLAGQIQECLRQPFVVKGHEFLLTTSIGIAIRPDDAADPDTLMKFADTAMYRAKQAGRDTFRFFTAQMNTEARARLVLEAALRRAVEDGEFVLHYQPRVQLDSGRISGVEALIRWERPGHGLVLPRDFLPILEETGLIVRVGRWVIATACEQIAAWLRSPIGPVQVSVNVSGRQFIDGGLDVDVTRSIAEHGIPANLLEVELTEASLLADAERTLGVLRALKALGVRISIDDFGTGYSSLAYLRRFPIDRLKIDIAFIRDVTRNPDDAAIVLAIVRMAHSMKLEAIAEGVETAAQLSYLRRLGCDHMLGYHFSPALTREGVEELLREDRRLPAPEGEPPLEARTLLLVDDEPGDLAALESLLRLDGYRILCAPSAEGAFELLALHRVQVIVCDEDMPGMNGTAFFDRVKDLYPDTFRMLLSGHADTASILGAVNAGAVHRSHLKPWDDRSLRENVNEAFRYHALLPELALGRSFTSVPYRTDDPHRAVETAQ